MVAYLVVFTLAPIVDTVRTSLAGRDGSDFPSLAGYTAIFGDEVFREAIRNTLVVALLSLALELAIGLGLALALHVRFPGRGLVRAVVTLPLGVPTIVSGAVMLLVFSRSGYLNSALAGIADTADRVPGVDWTFAPLGWTVAGGWRTLATVAIADTWKVLPLVTLVLLAGLQSIPEEVGEAARVDGASRWQRLRHVTLPLLVPFITAAIVLRAVDAFRIYELALVLAGRVEPVLGTYIAARYLPPIGDGATAASGSVVLFGIVAAFIVVYLKVVERAGDAERLG
jgi:trehalose transport system permease protein